MRGTRITVGVLASLAVFGTSPAAAAPDAQPAQESLQFLDISRPVGVHDAGPRSTEPQPGDVYVFANLLRHPERSDAVTRQVLGRFPSTCTVVQGTQVRCTGRLELRDGTIEVAGEPDLAATPIDMVITGGNGRYESVTGSARLTPTDRTGVNVLDVRLERPGG